LPGGHAQTIWPALCSRTHIGNAPRFRRERWVTPDDDFVDADWLSDATVPGAPPQPVLQGRPLLVLFHGLEGSSASHYARAFAHQARCRGWAFLVPHFRGCSGELNRAPRAYHSGDHVEIGWMLAQAQVRHAGPVLAVGVSLGGNALLRWAQEAQHSAAKLVRAVSSVCAPLDLMASGLALGQGFNRLVYTRLFLRTMRRKALRKWAQHPGLFDRELLARARDLYDFDNLFTAPLHGFRDTDDYWRRAAARPHLKALRVPALLVNAQDDPFVPAHSLPTAEEIGPDTQLWQPARGGHVGFATGGPPGHVLGMPAAVVAWLEAHL
jgi:uncharacterized protein